MNRFLQQFVGEPSDASWASARVEEETGASSFFTHKQQPSPPPAPQPQNDPPPLTSASTGGVYDTVDLFEDSSSAKHQQGYMLHGHGQLLHEEAALAEPQYDPPTSLFPSPRNGFGDPFAKVAASSLFSHGQRPPSPRRSATDMFGPSSEPVMTFPPQPQQQQQQHTQAASDPFGPSSAPGSSFPSRPPQEDPQSSYQQQNDPFASHAQAQSGLSFPPQQASFQAADPFAASPGLSFPPPPQESYNAAPSHQPQEPAPVSHSSSDAPAGDFFSSAPASASSLFSSGPPAVPSAADLFSAAPGANQQDWATQSFIEVAASNTPGPKAPHQEAAPVHQERLAQVEKNLSAPFEQAPPQQQFAVPAPAITPVQPPQAAPETSHVQPPRSQDRAYAGYSLPPRSQSSMAPPRSQSSQPPRSHKSALDDQIRLVEMYKQMAERLETEKNDLLKVLADQSDQFYRMQDYITSLEQELAAYRPPPQ